MSEEQNEINNQYDDLKTVINDAARVKADINSTCKESLKNMKRDFSEFMYDNVADEFKANGYQVTGSDIRVPEWAAAPAACCLPFSSHYSGLHPRM